MRASNRFLVSGGDEGGQHVIPTNISRPQESKICIIYALGNDGMGSDMHTKKENN